MMAKKKNNIQTITAKQFQSDLENTLKKAEEDLKNIEDLKKDYVNDLIYKDGINYYRKNGISYYVVVGE